MSCKVPGVSMDLSSYTDIGLLRLYSEILETLKARGTIRTNNAPIADYAEHLFCNAFGWEQEANSKAGYDAVSTSGERFQVKSRRLTPGNVSRQLGAIRRLDKNPFDQLAVVLFDQYFSVKRAAFVPIEIVQELAKLDNHTKSYKFFLRDHIWELAGVLDVTEKLANIPHMKGPK